MSAERHSIYFSLDIVVSNELIAARCRGRKNDPHMTSAACFGPVSKNNINGVPSFCHSGNHHACPPTTVHDVRALHLTMEFNDPNDPEAVFSYDFNFDEYAEPPLLQEATAV